MSHMEAQMGQLAKPLAAQYRTTDGVLPFALTGVTNEVATTRIRDGHGPSISWTLGHLLHFRHHALGLLGGPKEDSFASFANSSATDGNDYPDVVELRASLGRVGAQLQEQLATITDEQLGATLRWCRSAWREDHPRRGGLLRVARGVSPRHDRVHPPGAGATTDRRAGHGSCRSRKSGVETRVL